MTDNPQDDFKKTATAIFRYVIGETPRAALLERYEEALIKTGHSETLALPVFFKTFPSFIAFLELTGPKSKQQIARAEAIRIACFMAETDTAYVGRYCNAGGSKFWALFRLFWHLALEAFLLPVRVVFSLMAKPDRS